MDGITDSMDKDLRKLWDILEDREDWRATWGHEESDMT